jgi:hypothetical protein
MLSELTRKIEEALNAARPSQHSEWSDSVENRITIEL